MTELDDRRPQFLAPVSLDCLLAPVIGAVATDPNRAVLSSRDSDGFSSVSAIEFWGAIREMAQGLIGTGVGPGNRVAVMSATRAEWLIADLAINAVGAVTVPIYDTASAN